jgi:hypothetical protein
VSPELAFSLLNLAVLPWWGLWLVAPRSARALSAASHSGIFLALAGVYTLLLALAVGGGGFSGSDYASLRAALATPNGFLAGWTHYLVFDLFAGAWILRESRRIDVEPRPYLLLALLVGPVGLGGFLLRRSLRLRSLGQLGVSDLV